MKTKNYFSFTNQFKGKDFKKIKKYIKDNGVTINNIHYVDVEFDGKTVELMCCLSNHSHEITTFYNMDNVDNSGLPTNSYSLGSIHQLGKENDEILEKLLELVQTESKKVA